MNHFFSFSFSSTLFSFLLSVISSPPGLAFWLAGRFLEEGIGWHDAAITEPFCLLVPFHDPRKFSWPVAVSLLQFWARFWSCWRFPPVRGEFFLPTVATCMFMYIRTTLGLLFDGSWCLRLLLIINRDEPAAVLSVSSRGQQRLRETSEAELWV